MSRLTDILIDDTTWDGAAPERRIEWHSAISDLLAEHHFDLPGEGALRLLVTDSKDEVTLDVVELAGHVLARVNLPINAVQGSIDEYVTICRDLVNIGSGANSPRLEALDIAKRLTHDEAADTLVRLCRVLGPDHPTARRLFTLLVTLRVDTTSL